MVDRYQIDDINVSLLVPFGKQDGLSLGLQSRGTVTKETYDDGRPRERPGVRAVRHDLRRAAGHGRPLAQRRGAALRRRHLTAVRRASLAPQASRLRDGHGAVRAQEERRQVAGEVRQREHVGVEVDAELRRP